MGNIKVTLMVISLALVLTLNVTNADDDRDSSRLTERTFQRSLSDDIMSQSSTRPATGRKLLPPMPRRPSISLQWLANAGQGFRHKLAQWGSASRRVIGERLQRLSSVFMPSFDEFKNLFNKQYNSHLEEASRQLAYTRSLLEIVAQNILFKTGKRRWFSRVNENSDMSPEQFIATRSIPANYTDNPKLIPQYPTDALERMHREAQLTPLPYDPSIAGDAKDDDTLIDQQPIDDDQINEQTSELKEIKDKTRRRKRDSQSMDVDSDDDDDFDLENELKQVITDNIDFEPINLRHTECLSKPQHQSGCGACYAYASSAGAEYHYCMDSKAKSKLIFAPRFTSDCGHLFAPMGIAGCRGGQLLRALQFFSQIGGINFFAFENLRASQYGADGKLLQCYYDDGKVDSTQALDNLKSAKWPEKLISETFNEAEFYILPRDNWYDHLRAIGPIYINIAMPPKFQNFGGGVIDDEESSQQPLGTHSMLLVGKEKYIDNNGEEKPCWVLQNAEGAYWGEQGYVRMSALAIERLASLSIGIWPKRLQDNEQSVAGLKILY